VWRIDRYSNERTITMKTKLFALAATAFALFATTAAAATRVAATGCCPLCK
jgi:hypothetical protein